MIIIPLINKKFNIKNKIKSSYSFLVSRCYNKIEIKQELQKFYSIDIKNIRTITLPVKKKKSINKKHKTYSHLVRMKKIIITLSNNNKNFNTTKLIIQKT